MNIANNIKTLTTIAFCLLLTTVFTPAKAQDKEVIIASDKSLTTDFEQFKTFKWSSQAVSQDFIYTLNDAVLKARIREAIKFELGARGYRYSIEEPDLLINFRILEDSTTYTGYVDTFQDENYWGANEIRKDAIGLEPDAEVRGPEDVKTYFLDKGTLIVHLVNNKTDELIWTGYVSGLMDGDVFDNDEEQIRRAVHKLFTEEFNYTSKK